MRSESLELIPKLFKMPTRMLWSMLPREQKLAHQGTMAKIDLVVLVLKEGLFVTELVGGDGEELGDDEHIILANNMYQLAESK